MKPEPKSKPASVASRAPTARTVAIEVLERVTRDQAFAASALERALSVYVQLAAPDRALATELVYGTLRTMPYLLTVLGGLSSRGLGKLPPSVEACLCVAAYQLIFLERVPAHAVVHDAVAYVARFDRKLSGFANAILRRLARSKPPVSQREAILASTPTWLRESLARALGEASVAPYLTDRMTAATCVRVEPPGDRDTWVRSLADALPGATVEPGRIGKHAIRLERAGRIADLPGLRVGALTLQEEGSQLVAECVGASPGETVLDACAGRGHKTTWLARAVGPSGNVDAADLFGSKLRVLESEAARLGVRIRSTFEVDLTVGVGDLVCQYDRVLVDAPCSGTGTLYRRPEILRRRKPEELMEFRTKAITIAGMASRLVKPGGRLLFAVCSVLREEAEDAVEGLLAQFDDLYLAPFPDGHAHWLPEGEAMGRLLPHVHGTDGYFVASLKRRG